MKKLAFDNVFEAVTDDKELASEYQTRADLMSVIRDIIAAKGWEQKIAAKELGLTQPRVSDLVNGRIDKFSIDKLMTCLFRVGYRFKPKFKNNKLTMAVEQVEPLNELDVIQLYEDADPRKDNIDAQFRIQMMRSNT